MPYWAAQVHAQRLALATHLLGQRGYSTYVPMIASERRRGAIELLFPSYCFIAAQAQWSPARYCPGVLRLIGGRDDRPATISDAIVEGIRRRERKGLVELPPPPQLRPGSRVRVVSGLFSGRTGTVVLHKGMNGRERIAILLAAFGRIEVARGAVEAMV